MAGWDTVKDAPMALSVHTVKGQSPSALSIKPCRAAAQLSAENGIATTLESWYVICLALTVTIPFMGRVIL